MNPTPPRRPDLARRRLALALSTAPLLPLPALAQGPARNRPLRVAQLLDTNADQQELARDYSTGVRLGLAEYNQVRGNRTIELVTLNTDGSRASLQQALGTVRDDASICALLGTAGDRLASQSITATRDAGFAIAHVAPWMADSRHDADEQVFALFASREAQIRHALKSLESMGVNELGVVYTSMREQQALQAEIASTTSRLKLRTQVFVPAAGEDLAALPARVGPQLPAILLFLGGTLELSRLTLGLSQHRPGRYVVSLSDVDVPTLMQLGSVKSVPQILTQVVPNPQTSSLPVVRNYRGILAKLFDESPSHISLSGYLAARYATQVLARLDGTPTRDQALAEFQKRQPADLGGFAISFSAQQRRGSSFVTQTLLTGDGRLIG